MSHPAIIHDEEPIRLFKSDFLEFFTHISPITVTVIWLPVSAYFFWLGVQQSTGGWRHLIAAFLLGLLIWTPTEYLAHRFIFHFHPRNKLQERIAFLFHGVHHAQPQCKTRLVMPLPVSIPLAALFYVLFTVIVGMLFRAPTWVMPMLSGFTIGYLTYDLTHYATHHFAMRDGYLKFLKRYHMQHHYKTPEQRFGVSSPVWDMVFGTYPKATTKR